MKSTSNLELLEQEICISCGICCDGTLFNKASLNPGEKGSLPVKIEQNYFLLDGKEKFKLPCPYFNKKCTIYNQKKAIVCSAFRCQLLEDFASGKILKKDALAIVEKAKISRNELLDLYQNMSAKANKRPFHDILLDLNDPKNNNIKTSSSRDMKILIARFKIFESLLTKYFKSEEDFQEMLIRNDINNK